SRRGPRRAGRGRRHWTDRRPGGGRHGAPAGEQRPHSDRHDHRRGPRRGRSAVRRRGGVRDAGQSQVLTEDAMRKSLWLALLLAAAHAEAQELLNRAKAVAEKERAALLAKAREEYEQLLTRARKDIGEEREKALLELRREAVELTIAATSRLLEAKLDTEANRRLVTEYLATLEQRQ